MAFHVPPDVDWNPHDVLDSLTAIGLPAYIESGFLRIDAPVNQHPHPVLGFLQRFRFLRPLFGEGYPPYHEFNLCADRFINNLEIHWNVHSLAENEHILHQIRDAMRSQGFDEVGLNPTERDIVQRYGVPGGDLDLTLGRLGTMRASRNPDRDHEKWWAEWKSVNAKLERICISALPCATIINLKRDDEPCHPPKDRMAFLQMETTLAVLGDDSRLSGETHSDDMYASRFPKVTLDFINGYLAPIALMMDYVTPEVGFDYYFHQLPGNVAQSSIDDAVRRTLERSFRDFNKHNGTRYDDSQIDNLIDNHFSLKPFANWQTKLAPRVSKWIGEPFGDALKTLWPNTVWPPTFMVDDFTDVLTRFFGEARTDCWLIDGDIKDELYYHWGGVNYDDYFFESDGRVYHLHFDLCD